MMAALWIAVLPSCAQKKEIDEARTIIKSGKTPSKAEKLMTNLLAKSKENRENPKIYATWFDAVEAQYVQANEKLYLKQKYDTAAFFNLTRKLYDIALTLDTLDGRPNKKGKVKYEYRKAHGELLDQLRPNLYYGGTYHVRKNEFEDAYSFFSHYLDAATHPFFATYRYAQTDSLLSQAAYWATYCGYRMQDAQRILRYSKEALAYEPRTQYVFQYLCEAYQLTNHQEKYLETLKEGFRRYPEYPYFFPRLADYYMSLGKNDSLMTIAEYGLHVNATSPLFLLAKSMALLNTERYEECIAVSKQMIALNEDMPEPYLQIATCYLNQALDVEQKGESRKNRKQLQQLYSTARPYLELYRKLMPEDRQRWAPGLYRIYLNLNMGKQFEEIDRLMK